MTEEHEDRELDEKPDGDDTLEQWAEAVKSGVERSLEATDPKDDPPPMLHIELPNGQSVITVFEMDTGMKDQVAASIRVLTKWASRAAFITSAWARVADKEKPLTEREKAALDAGEFHASLSIDRIEVISVTLAERREGAEARLGVIMGEIKRSDGPPQIEWMEETPLWESDDNKARAEGRFPDALRAGLS